METIAIEKLRPYAKNAKKHNKKQVALIAKSIKEFGFDSPIIVDKDNVIIAGHGRLEGAKLLELKEVPVIRKEKLTEDQVKAYRLADNKIAESEWDMGLVIEELKELSEEMFEITGFDPDLLIEPDEKDDEVPEITGGAKSQEGDLYELGNHRLLCGNSTKKEDLERLMKGQKADMLFTDPPYNVDYKGAGKKTSQGILNDKMDNVEFGHFLVDAFSEIAKAIKKTAGCYIFHSHKTAQDFATAIKACGYIIDTQLIWNKPSAGMGMNDYRTKHEPFYYCYLSKEDKVFYGDRKGTTVWKIPENERDALKWFKRQLDKEENGKTTIWTMKRANTQEYVHPTQKPVELIATAITKSSKPEDIVLDTFLGSGSTLIAAEKTGRHCYGMDLDPKFVDTIVQRYVNFTENENIKKNGKQIIWPKTE